MPSRTMNKLSIDLIRVWIPSLTRLYSPIRFVEVSASAFGCHPADWRCVWMKGGSYGSQIRVTARYEVSKC